MGVGVVENEVDLADQMVKPRLVPAARSLEIEVDAVEALRLHQLEQLVPRTIPAFGLWVRV